MTFRSGYINIIGKPNAGKSTLLNQILGHKLSIISPKAQTTRHRILGIVTTPDYQAIFTDNPGIIEEPGYGLHEAMNAFIKESLEDADVLILLIDLTAPALPEEWQQRIIQLKIPVVVALNKTDLVTAEVVTAQERIWKQYLPQSPVIPVIAEMGAGVGQLVQAAMQHLPEGPLYYPDEPLTDRTERFFVAEIIREKILELYRQEVPYSVEVVIDRFEEGEKLDKIAAVIYVNRKSQKPILIGKGGASIKQLGIAARLAIESFLEKRVHLELHVKVKENWREDPNALKGFGYQH